ncbi:MAG: D-alanine--D-alanine ligase, partial [Chitinophagaceae bacterium]|nr:D-alanine--D-alanine ligase [Chitinophagaceae bacterium]
MRLFKLFTHHPFFIRLFHWEYWSFTIVYGWIYPFFALLCVRAGGKFFFTAANPTIKHGGFLMEPKQEIYPLIPKEYYPAFFFVPAGTTVDVLHQQIENHQFSFPLIAKPVIGMQGKAVKKINSPGELKEYADLCTVDYMIQELSLHKYEVGVFYHRFPNETNGTVTGIVAKEPMTIVGDGESSIYQLIMEVPRYILQMDALKQM